MQIGYDNALSVFPCNDQKRPLAELLPDGKWESFGIAPPDDETFGQWMRADFLAYAIACGPASGGLLALDFETRAAFDEWLASVGDLAKDLILQETPGGGVHAIFRVNVSGDFYRNDKLALDPEKLREPGPRKKDTGEAWTAERFVSKFVTTDPASRNVILAKARAAGVSKRESEDLFALAVNAALIISQSDPVDRRKIGYVLKGVIQ
jgi:hypothetical protein